MTDSIRTRVFPESNYKAIYHNGKTIRLALNKGKEITELPYPEFWDVKITNKCNGLCPWCYQSSTPNGEHVLDVVGKAFDFFSKMDSNQRPFQVAIGGGEPTLHPDFGGLLKLFFDLKITPNYTTNGMHLTDQVLEDTKKYCGGVAISCHPHLQWQWARAAKKLAEEKIRMNFHVIISDKTSILWLKSLIDWYDYIDYFVLLPYTAQGRASSKEVDWDCLCKVLEELPSERMKQIAFGANFHKNLQSKKVKWDVSLYEPEIFSKYLDMTSMKVYKSSFSNNEVEFPTKG